MSKNSNHSKNHRVAIVVECILLFFIIATLISIYVVGGMIGAFAWSTAIFVLAPISTIACIIYMVWIITRMIRKKEYKWIIIHQVTFMMIAFPILMLFDLVTIPYPGKINVTPPVIFQNPVVGETVVFGGKSYRTHAMWPSECYAYDILAKPYEVGSNNLEDYGIFGRDVVAPIQGTILEVHDGEPDIIPNSEEFTSSFGNYIFMKIEETNTYLIFAHLKRDSICITVGDKVTPGIKLAQVGNSGTTSEPHLHFQHQQNDPTKMQFPIYSVGLPINFAYIYLGWNDNEINQGCVLN